MKPAPKVQAYYYLPNFNKSLPVEFLIDTGAAASCLNSADAHRLNPVLKDTPLFKCSGVGGPCSYYSTPAVIIFKD